MKKIPVLISVLAVAACVLSACGNSDDTVEESGKVNIEISQNDTSVTTAPQDQSEPEATEQPDETSITEAETTVSETEVTAAETTVSAENKTETTTTTTKTATTTTKKATTTTVTTTTKKPAETKAPQQTGSFSDADASIVYNGATVTINADFSSAKSKLGNPDSKQENPNCISGETGYTYIYGNMTVDVYVSGNSEYVEAVMVEGDKKAKTSKGIAVGSSVSDITTAYGKADDSDDFITEYTGSTASLLFFTEGGKVTGFFMTRNY